jgi:hypothetical protein
MAEMGIPRAIGLGAAALLLGGCPAAEAPPTRLVELSIESLDGILTRSGVSFDPQVSADGNGSLRVVADAVKTVRLHETGAIDVENARLTYRARIRTEAVRGRVYLEMWCHFPGRGEFFSRALATPLSGTTEWSSQQTPFLLKAGESPDNIRLNLVVEGPGTVWIDDIVLESLPLD